ncbi:MAG: hypothetical protein ACREQL_08715 [Candidatus Binatia bacterium]
MFTRHDRFIRSVLAGAFVLVAAAGVHAFTIDDFAVLAPHVNPFDQHEVFYPDFNTFDLQIAGSFDASKCYQVTIKREGGGLCGSANSSGSDDATVTASLLTAAISPQAAADFKGAGDWRIAVIERTGPGCTGSSTEVLYGDEAGETPLSIIGCNQTCLLDTITLTPTPATAGCGDSVQLCASTGGSGNLKYEFDTDADGTVDVTKITNDVNDPQPCMEGQPCCIAVMPSANVSPTVHITDLGTNVTCEKDASTSVTVIDDCSDGDACNGVESCVAGACAVTTAAPDCSGLDNQCNTGVCQSPNGSCVAQPKQNGTGCDDGNACTQSDTCQAGTCAGTNPVVCTALDQCHVPGTCNPESGVCSNPNKADGSSCNDGSACTQTDTCQAGTCTGTNPVVCTALDQCHDPGACNPANGQCSNPAKSNGSTCSDGNACTQTDTCQAGSCVGGNPKVCTPLDACHDAGVCNSGTGQCTNPSKPAGYCDDQSVCTTDSCNPQTGCVHQAISCNDSNACTRDSCNPTAGCQHAALTCNDGSICTTDSCDPASGCKYVFDPDLDVRCTETHACRSAGFWGTHGADPYNLTQMAIDAGGGCLDICGEVVTNTVVSSADSAIEGICISPRGDMRLQLARQLTAMSLNCAMNGFYPDCSGHVRFAPLFAACNDACTQGTADVGDCIAASDCFNNGGEIDLANGLCITDTIANCHLRPLPSPFDASTAATSSQRCSAARKNDCTLLPPGELAGCTQPGLELDPAEEACNP